MRGGDEAGPLATAATALWKAVRAAREVQNERFATLLAKWSSLGADDPRVLPVERVLDDRIAGLASHCPVLKVVMDGRGAAVFRELHAALARRGWAVLCRATWRGALGRAAGRRGSRGSGL